MGVTKKSAFKEDVKNLADVFKALGHPARIQILNLLLSKKSCSCGTIVQELPLAQSTVSKHLLELKKANLINISFSGKNSIYTIENSKLNILNQFLENYINNQSVEQIKSSTNVIIQTPKKQKKSITSKNNLKQFNYQFKKKKIENEI